MMNLPLPYPFGRLDAWLQENKMKYLASPYSHPSKHIRMLRYINARACVGHFLLLRDWVYSPIVHCHPLALEEELPTDAAFWEDYNQNMMDRAAALYVLKLPGWDTSIGVDMEITYAARLGLPISYVEYESNNDGAPLFRLA